MIPIMLPDIDLGEDLRQAFEPEWTALFRAIEQHGFDIYNIKTLLDTVERATPAPLKPGGLDECFIIIKVVAQGGQDGLRGDAALPLLAAVQLVEELRKGSIGKDGIYQVAHRLLGQLQEPPALVLYVQPPLHVNSAARTHWPEEIACLRIGCYSVAA